MKERIDRHKVDHPRRQGKRRQSDEDNIQGLSNPLSDQPDI
jgi:hypothetical protein